MVVRLIDFIGRCLTVTQILELANKGMVIVNEAQVENLEKAKASFIHMGMSEAKASVYAAYECGYISDPEMVCQLANINLQWQLFLLYLNPFHEYFFLSLNGLCTGSILQVLL